MTAMKKILALTITAFALVGLLQAAPASAQLGVVSFDGSTVREDGEAATQAASHPFVAGTSFRLSSHMQSFPARGTEGLVPDGYLRSVAVALPPGLVGNPNATVKCTPEQFKLRLCPDGSQVGIAHTTFVPFGSFQSSVPSAVYNMDAPPGTAAEFAFYVLSTRVFLSGTVRTGGDYGVNINVDEISGGLDVLASSVELWGNPAASTHDSQRGNGVCSDGGEAPCPAHEAVKPFLRLPTSCVGPVSTSLRIDSWEEPGHYAEASFLSHDTKTPPNPVGVEGCGRVSFEPTFTVMPTSHAADSPTGLDVNLHLPQSESPEGLGEGDLKKAVVTLPEGMSVNPSSVNGLGVCSAAQIDLRGPNMATCPSDSKIGSAEVDTPLLEAPIKGGVYLAKQNENKFNSLLAVYIAAEDPRSGVVVKLPGKVDADPATGRLTTTFDENPQLPFEDLSLELFGGSRAPLLNPPDCGRFSVQTELSPWARPEEPVVSTSTFQITSGPNGAPCPNGSFDPKLAAGTTNPIAAAYSPFVLRLTREDGSQRLGAISAKLPAGLTGKLAGIPYCPDAALAGVSGQEGTGGAQIASPSCPAASQVGTVVVGAGAGPNPFYVHTGRAYLAGPYKGAPLSMAFVTPAVAGPFDLGSVVVRAALQVNPVTTEITAVSDPLPTILHGIPLDLKDVRVNLDRPGFTLNPTNCDPAQITSTISSAKGGTATPSSRFQVADCASLPFAPKLALRVFGRTNRNAKPRLRAILQTRPGEANIGRAQVNLPHSLFLEQAHIKTVCTRVQWAEGAGHGSSCPKGSIYGRARAWTPLLDRPLEGPVYLRSSSHKLPDLVAALNGQVDIELAGKVDSGKNEGLRNTFEFVPDAPVTKFMLEMKGKKKGLLVNSEELCSKKARKRTAIVRLTGQNGKVHQFRPHVRASCGKAGKKKARAGHERAGARK